MLAKRRPKVLLLALAALAAGCDSSTEPDPVPASVAVSRHPGTFVRTGQGSTAGVLVLDASGDPVEGVQVRWEVVAGAGSVNEGTTRTDSTGQAFAFWQLEATAGEQQRLRATVAGLQPVEFTTTPKDFYFWLISPPAPGPGAVVTSPSLRVEANTDPYRATTDGYMVEEFTLSIGDRVTGFGAAAGPSRWIATLSLAGLPPGPHTYRVFARDVHGNTHEETVRFTYVP